MTILNKLLTINRQIYSKKNKIVSILILLIFLLSTNYLIINLKTKSIQTINATTHSESDEYIEYTGKVEYLAFSSLIAFPDKAFSTNSTNDYYDTKLTTNEFKKILEQLYKNNYIIVDIENIYKKENSNIIKQSLMLPKNKKF